ncbi:maleylpyruvate isomerase N-terminal domain-containing protein [Agromyces kandeliae]|uniref:Mycothiol-dependent maleylpyruvate isomerase metal-binding domain-containing protein n=1 Tax=Agromyces kandeliae TaxID=2666141 RepID=A0A6L5QWK4_9MICO|nr:maleylpyruvate isomerase N-terminal domain-containing protein [Agromyces kandeliae]MRX42176.1 hypothetical protein [Agromyces kandeliae]
MGSLADLRAAVEAFTATAAETDPEAPVRSETWPTAGRIIDHLGNIQRWAAEVLRTGAPADRAAFRRPADAERIPWFTAGAAGLIEAIERTDPDRPCAVLFGELGRAGFWRRRMSHEAAKHLWDLRTARDEDPPFPPEVSGGGTADVIDEFGDVFMPQARRRGIRGLPGDLVLAAADAPAEWRLSPDWVLERGPVVGHAPAATVRASLGDLVLLVWERADPYARAGRFDLRGDDSVMRAFVETPVHL